MDKSQSSRAGIAKNLTLDRDAVALIPLLVEGYKGAGKLMSELLRAEYDRRAERARWAGRGQAPWTDE